MKNRFKTILIPIVSASLLGIATASYADKGNCEHRDGGKGAQGQKLGFKGHPGSAMRVERMASRLDLTDVQQNQVEAIIEASKDDQEALYKKIQSNREALREAMSSGNTASVRSLADQKGDLVAELTVLRSNDRTQIKAVLTSEQQEDFAEMKNRRPVRR